MGRPGFKPGGWRQALPGGFDSRAPPPRPPHAQDGAQGEGPHGMRSCFRSWAGERTTFESDVIEMCLAHVVGSRVQKAYMRSDVLTKRAKLMQAWANFVSKSSHVIPMERSA